MLSQRDDCLPRALSDQLLYDEVFRNLKFDYKMIRDKVVNALPDMIKDNMIDFTGPEFVWGSKEAWMSQMKKDGEYADDVFLQLAEVVFRKKITVVHVIGGHTTNYPLVANTESYPSGIYVLYYEEAHFGSPHYQSVRPIARAPRETLPSIPS